MKNILKNQIKSVEDIYKSAMRVFENHRGGDFSDLLPTVKMVILAEMELFELHALPLEEFIKIKISHFSGDGKIAKYNCLKYGEVNVLKYCETLKELLKITEKQQGGENETNNQTNTDK